MPSASDTERYGRSRPGICVTGMGAVTPLGNDAVVSHERWTAGECAIENGFGRCHEFVPQERLSRKQVRRLDRFAQIALCAAQEAMEQAGWAHELPSDPRRIGCVLGTGGGPMTSMLEMYEVFYGKAQGHIPPVAPIMAMANGACAAITLGHGLKGESFAIVAACSAGSQAIGAAMRMLQLGQLDAVIAGGSDCCTNDWSYKAFTATGALSPSGVVRPFDRNRDGFVLGEGGAVLVLERRDVAERRGAPILAEVLGYGASTDAFHVTKPDPDGPARAIESALGDAGLRAEDIDWVNAHATGTRLNDPCETLALKTALGERAYEIPISAPKAAMGHLIGGAGAVESVATISAMRARVAPPTLHLTEPDDDLDLDYVPLRAAPLPSRQEKERIVAMNNSFAFGGHNAILIFASDG
ncbi:MAG: beta-ketoacyl-[acyl-carrier-protein] synthase family protein [Solirubrobacterales bacterium]